VSSTTNLQRTYLKKIPMNPTGSVCGAACSLRRVGYTITVVVTVLAVVVSAGALLAGSVSAGAGGS
jgi:hypothetical protein